MLKKWYDYVQGKVSAQIYKISGSMFMTKIKPKTVGLNFSINFELFTKKNYHFYKINVIKIICNLYRKNKENGKQVKYHIFNQNLIFMRHKLFLTCLPLFFQGLHIVDTQQILEKRMKGESSPVSCKGHKQTNARDRIPNFFNNCSSL